MKNERIIVLPEVVSGDDVKQRVKTVGVRNLSIDKAEELGVFQRISHVLCGMHALTLVAFRLYAEADIWLTELGAKKHEIKRACRNLEEAYRAWEKFWRDYSNEDGKREMRQDTDDLFLQFMRWASLPLNWSPGESQEMKRNEEPLIEIDLKGGDSILRIYRDVAERENLSDIKEEWCVMKCDYKDGNRVMGCMEKGMDKASAQMSAKRMSANDKGVIYTASLLQTIEERRLEVVPYKAFLDGNAVGSIKKIASNRK